MWKTYNLAPDHAYVSYFRCLWCGERGHLREDCARIHNHGAVTDKDGVCLGCNNLADEMLR